MNDARVDDVKPRRRRWYRYIGAALVALALLLSVGLWAMTFFGMKAAAAQRRYHAVICVCELVATHVERDSAHAWPRS